MLTSSNKSNVGNARKVISFYRLNFGLNAPYTALVDSETLVQSSKGGVYLKDAISKLLSGDGIKLSVTDCTVRKLRSGGDKTKGSELFARRLQRISCTCGDENEIECLKETAEKQTNLIMVTCYLSSVKIWPQHVAVIFLNKHNQLSFRSPSKQTIEHVKQTQAQKTGLLNQADRVLVQQAVMEERERKKRKREEIFGSEQNKKRKKTKGPNPLSMKKSTKKKNSGESDPKTKQDDKENNDSAGKSRKRRMRGKRGKSNTKPSSENSVHPSNNVTINNAPGNIASDDNTTNHQANDIDSQKDEPTKIQSDNKHYESASPVKPSAHRITDLKKEIEKPKMSLGNRKDLNTEQLNNNKSTVPGKAVAKETKESTIGKASESGQGEISNPDESATPRKSIDAGKITNETQLSVPADITYKCSTDALTDKKSEGPNKTASDVPIDTAAEDAAGQEGGLIENAEPKKKKKQRKNRRRPGSNKNKS